MRSISRASVCLLLVAFASSADSADRVRRNHLGSEKSPYLLQHAENPVWWWSWSTEALAEAKKQDKPIFLSIGYSTCHWCHVMEHESFENTEVAEQLNQHFIAIKVDREERPDLDAIYMRAVEAMTGRGGWPMTVILTPQGRPFFGGTYFPKDRLLSILQNVARAWKNDRASIEKSMAELSRTLNVPMATAAQSLSGAQLVKFAESERENFDSVNGGIKGAPKFPPAYALDLLLRIHRRHPDPALLAMVTTTLDAMARGGIYDHVGGGFHRYSTDEHWMVPHFEKMLYDQAALANVYLDAFASTGNPEYALVVRETLDYVLRDMTDPAGGFYSAEDADSDGKEGTFYLWREAELRALLSAAEFSAVQQAFGVTSAGNFEGANILHLSAGDRAHRSAELTRALGKMAEARAHRVRPRRDDKIITAWNGLMIGAFARAARTLAEPRYAAAAARAAGFVLDHNHGPDGTLRRHFRSGEARQRAMLSDYTNLVGALIDLYQTDFNPAWLHQAAALQSAQEKRFTATDGGYFLTDGSDSTLIERPQDFEDNVEPAGTSIAAMNLLRLSDLFLDDSYRGRATRIFDAASTQLKSHPTAFSALLGALDYALEVGKEVAIIGEPHSAAMRSMLAAVRQGFRPNMVVGAGPSGANAIPILREKMSMNGKPTVYVCQKKVCALPTTDPIGAVRQLDAVPLKME